MRKTTIEFDIDDPEDKRKLFTFLKTPNLLASLWHIRNLLSKEAEYKLEIFGDDPNPELTKKLYEHNDYIRNRFIEILDECDVDLDELG